MENLLEQIDKERIALKERIQELLEPYLQKHFGVQINIGLHEAGNESLSGDAVKDGWEFIEADFGNYYKRPLKENDAGGMTLYLRQMKKSQNIIEKQNGEMACNQD